MPAAPALTPLPDDYFRSIRDVEDGHWWHVGMRQLAAVLLGKRLERRDQSLLDAGCGTGGFLAWAGGLGSFSKLAGFDVSAEAVELARTRLPEAELAVAPVALIPFPAAAFDVVTLNDVLQHVHEDEVAQSLGELRRVLAPEGALLVRTNGARHGRRDAPDWRVYSPTDLRATLEEAGLRVERITYANAVLSAWGQLRGRGPKLPDEGHHGIPRRAGRAANTVGSLVLSAERQIVRAGVGLPYGHTLLALAAKG
jgi:SAM-dependent methyltransferase